MLPISFHLLATTASADVYCPGSTDTTGTSATCATGLPKVTAGSGELHTALSIFFGIAAVISVLMIVIGSIMFVTSGGNPESVAKARQTIIYSVIGLAISLLAEVFVAFILGKI